ncbi:TraU family protein [Azohydromonas australica]|uniref:TraU family protein n=1 Tax=Azohydromonas australica TaxID=364039 RepID=UPI001EE3DF2A|nr:TraU family protein [Azohydromonas australica]
MGAARWLLAPVLALACTGCFPNPLTDLCWSRILPISIGSATVAGLGGQENIANPPSPLCSRGVNPIVGLSVGCREPVRHVEVVHRPFCLPSLGGVDLDPSLPAFRGARFTRFTGRSSPWLSRCWPLPPRRSPRLPCARPTSNARGASSRQITARDIEEACRRRQHATRSTSGRWRGASTPTLAIALQPRLLVFGSSLSRCPRQRAGWGPRESPGPWPSPTPARWKSAPGSLSRS